MNNFEKSTQTVELPVCKDYGDDEDFFRLMSNGTELRLQKLLFQKGQPLPDTLICRLRSVKGMPPQVMHNMPLYVNEFYADGFSKGQEFEFKVINRPYDENGYYKLEDKNGLQIRLRETKSPFTIGQTVKCKFEYLDQKVYVLRRSNTDSLLAMYRIKDIARTLHLTQSVGDKLNNRLRTMPQFEKAIEEHDNGYPSWVFTAMRAIKGSIAKWFAENVEKMPTDQIHSILAGCKATALHLIERSGFLRNIKGLERQSMQSEFTDFIELIDTYQDALRIIDHHGQQRFIDDLLNKLKESGYIYHPHTQFAIMMILFRVSPELVNKSLGNIFDALMGWDIDIWRTEPFRQAFVEQLEIFIADTREDVDNFLQPETADDNEKIEKALTAMAIQQALCTDKDTVDMRLNLSFFYRCLSLLRRAKADTLLDKAFLTLMGVKLPTDFKWIDIKEPTMMMTRAAVDPPAVARLSEDSKYFSTDTLELEINNKGVCITRHDEGDVMPQVPNNMLAWPPLQVKVNLPHALSRTKIKSLDGHAEFWHDVENELFKPREVKSHYTSAKKLTPDIGDTVRIEIDRVQHPPMDYNKVDYFHCVIVDEHFTEGEGILTPGELVGYNLHGITTGVFRHDDGRPMRFDAKVVDIDSNDTIHFSLIDAVNDAINDMVMYGDTTKAVITKDNGRNYSAISEKGYGLYIKKDPDDNVGFRNGNVVLVTVDEFQGNLIFGSYEDGPLNDQITNATMLRNMLRNITVDQTDNSTTVMEFDEDMIPAEDIQELVQILRFKAVSLSDDIIAAYDYLSYAQLLARLINDEMLINEIKAHKQMLLLHQHYAKNKSIFTDDVRQAVELAPDSLLAQRMAKKLDIVACLGQSELNQKLWTLSNSSSNEMEKSLAQFVLSFNLLYDMNRDDETAAAIKERIAKALNVSGEQRNLKYYGSENQYVEFKSSIVYPARKGKSGISAADPDKQEYEILHIIAGFLNTTGGTLYIGVNDDHYERGLEEDFKFYKLDNSEKNTPHRRNIKTLDNMANYLQNLIDKSFSLGVNAGEYAKTDIDDEALKGVICVKVSPCPRPVYFDGKIFVRHSAKTVPLTRQEDITNFLEDRKSLYEKQVNADNAALAETEQPPVEDAKEEVTEAVAVVPAVQETYEIEVQPTDVSTSKLRKNVLHEYIDPEHFTTPSFYVRFVDDNRYMITNDEWSLDETDRIDLAVLADEADQYLLLIYDNEHVVKVPMRELLEKKKNIAHSHNGDNKLVFAVPAHSGDGIYSLHTNSKGTIYERFTPVEEIQSGSMGTSPERIMEADCDKTLLWELVPASRAGEFAGISSSSFKRSQPGALAKSLGNSKIQPKEAIANFYDKFK